MSIEHSVSIGMRFPDREIVIVDLSDDDRDIEVKDFESEET